MAVKIIKQFRLECDVCGKQSDMLSTGTLGRTSYEWRLRRYMQKNGYRFYLLACSDGCQSSWETTYLDSMLLNSGEEIPLAVWVESL